MDQAGAVVPAPSGRPIATPWRADQMVPDRLIGPPDALRRAARRQWAVVFTAASAIAVPVVAWSPQHCEIAAEAGPPMVCGVSASVPIAAVLMLLSAVVAAWLFIGTVSIGSTREARE